MPRAHRPSPTAVGGVSWEERTLPGMEHTHTSGRLDVSLGGALDDYVWWTVTSATSDEQLACEGHAASSAATRRQHAHGMLDALLDRMEALTAPF